MPNGGGRFPHLPLPRTFQVPTQRERPKRDARDEKTKNYTDYANRPAHAADLTRSIADLKTDYHHNVLTRIQAHLPELPEAIPMFLELDPNTYEPDSLAAFGIEVLLEEEGGIVIGATSDTSFSEFNEKILRYLDASQKSNASPAKVWSVQGGTVWRTEKLLSARLQQIFPTLVENQIYVVDATIVVKGLKSVPVIPRREDFASDKKFSAARKRFDSAYEKWDALMSRRQLDFDRYISEFGGVASGFCTDAPEGAQVDSFSCRIKITVKGMKDLVENYPFLAGLEEPDEVKGEIPTELAEAPSPPFELNAPGENAPKICVIDSGIQENHRYLDAAIHTIASRCFIPNEVLTADRVRWGGHGTRVAGAILFPRTVPTTGTQQAHGWIQNARVLDENNIMPLSLYPPALIRDVVNHYVTTFATKLFNHSITGSFPHRTGRMSAWASTIDHLCYQNDVLVIIAAGNIDRNTSLPTRKCVRELATGNQCPDFLLENTCRVANPAQSLQALTVGSIALDAFNDGIWRSLAMKDQPSAFSRTGLGIWGTIKPELVEYGGDYVRDSNTPLSLAIRAEICPELIRATLDGGPAFARDTCGTSFAAPKVMHIAAELARIFPTAPSLLYRALIVQSARWPGWAVEREPTQVLRLIGYGIPDISRATENTNHRVTVITDRLQRIHAGNVDLYEIPIPAELRRQGDNHQIRIEVTLSYRAKPHRLRRTTRRYLSTWLDWTVNLTDEEREVFLDRVRGRHDDSDPHPWTISKRRNAGAQDVRLSDSTVQKDWTVIECHELPEVFCIAVVAHRVGAKKDADEPAEYSLAVTLESEGATVNVYEPIRVALEQHVRIQPIEVEQQIEIGAAEFGSAD